MLKAILRGALAVSVFTLAGAYTGSEAAEVVIKAVTALPSQTDYATSFQKFVEKVNRAGKGTVRINYIGGPEAIPPASQGDAVRQGIVDMVYGPTSYWLGVVPEGDALVGSNVSVAAARENGGLSALDKIYREKLNAHLLGWFDTGIAFHIYTTKRPRAAGESIDLSGTKIRSNPIYLEFFKKLGIVNIAMPAPEVYTALERGIVEGVGWPIIGVTDLGWERFLRYRIDPGFFQIDTVALVNNRKWGSLPQGVRDLLTKAAVEHEQESHAHFQAEQKRIDEMLKRAGLEVITLPEDQRRDFVKLAFETVWQRLAERSPAHASQLRSLFYRN